MLLVLALIFGVTSVAAAQTATGATLPADIHLDSRNRLPALKPGLQGVAAIRLHSSGVDVRWQSPLGRQLSELAILTSAREHDQPYEWSLHEMEALAVGLDPSVIDIVRHRQPTTGVAAAPAVIIAAGRELFGEEALSAATYARALEILGTAKLVDAMTLMANYAGTASRLTAFNQHMPPGWKQLLPLPFTQPGDIHADTRSRVPYVKTNELVPGPLYSRALAPEGTGPTQLRRHGSAMKLLQASVGARITALAALVTAQEHHQPYHWRTTEAAARAAGLDATSIDIVRNDRALTGIPDKDAALIQFARELFRRHSVAPDTYARALKLFGERDLVDLVDLMGVHATDAVLLTAFDQH